jgi:hypothetical protein
MQLPFFKKKAKSSGLVGVSVTGDVMAVAHLEMLVKSMGLDGEQCSYVLDYQEYSMHLVEAPNVEP